MSRAFSAPPVPSGPDSAPPCGYASPMHHHLPRGPTELGETPFDFQQHQLNQQIQTQLAFYSVYQQEQQQQQLRRHGIEVSGMLGLPLDFNGSPVRDLSFASAPALGADSMYTPSETNNFTPRSASVSMDPMSKKRMEYDMSAKPPLPSTPQEANAQISTIALKPAPPPKAKQRRAGSASSAITTSSMAALPPVPPSDGTQRKLSLVPAADNNRAIPAGAHVTRRTRGDRMTPVEQSAAKFKAAVSNIARRKGSLTQLDDGMLDSATGMLPTFSTSAPNGSDGGAFGVLAKTGSLSEVVQVARASLYRGQSVAGTPASELVQSPIIMSAPLLDPCAPLNPNGINNRLFEFSDGQAHPGFLMSAPMLDSFMAHRSSSVISNTPSEDSYVMFTNGDSLNSNFSFGVSPSSSFCGFMEDLTANSQKSGINLANTSESFINTLRSPHNEINERLINPLEGMPGNSFSHATKLEDSFTAPYNYNSNDSKSSLADTAAMQFGEMSFQVDPAMELFADTILQFPQE
ncbi:hypothetical protein HDU82_005516 [Entophlyctis luteolus]|nr:hypothetical protein HDU82_005516 [Entophlyctis luteolus]